MRAFLDGIAVQFYRGIGAETQYIAPFSRLNFFIGANNSGKSIVLNLISSKLSNIRKRDSSISLDGPEIYKGKKTGDFLIAVGRSTKNPEALIGSIRNKRDLPPDAEDSLQEIIKNRTISECIWASFKENAEANPYPPVDIDEAAKWQVKWSRLWQIFTIKSGGDLKEHWIPQVLSVISNSIIPAFPNIYLIPAKRVLGGKAETFDDLTGKGLIDHLAALQNPAWDKQEDREKFRRINAFLQEVIGKSDATLEVPNGREHLLIHLDNKVLPLSSLGTGIHEVVLIAAFCTIHDGSIMCIEEPEIHLHPLLQRKLINYLIENTSSQYFIATHSSAFIDAPSANVFHVSNDGDQTRVKPVLTHQEQCGILDDLGCQASDLLQSNAVIWVEGPSDRIYLNHWIKATDNRLTEGIHYTIMFYGGALIRHLTASDDALEEFIRLRDLNRNMAIIIDSDRDSNSSPLKTHAERLRKEMNSDGGLAWVTAGREVENYIDGAKLQAALKRLHSGIYRAPCKTGPFDHAFYFFRDNPKKPGERQTFKEADKVGAAAIVCEGAADLDILDLRKKIELLVAMIRKSNGLSEV